jgi:hypothetical protein
MIRASISGAAPLQQGVEDVDPFDVEHTINLAPQQNEHGTEGEAFSNPC